MSLVSRNWSRRKFLISSMASSVAVILATGETIAQGQPSQEKKTETHSSDSIEDKVKQIIVDDLSVDPAAVIPSARIMADLGADSLDAVEIILTLEKEFDIHIRDEDVVKLYTVKDVVDYVRSRVKSQKARKSPRKK